MKKNLLLTPGPTQVPPSVCEALGRPIIHHRTPQFQNEIKEAIEGLQYIFQTKNDIYLLTCSGTGAMEASVCNLLSPGDKAVAVEAGKFGERWTELCKTYKVDARVVKIEWGKAVTPAEIQGLLKAEPDIKAVFITLCETSTGVTPDVQGIARVVKESNAVLVLDAISGLGVQDVQTDNWGIDVVVTGSQKGLMLPPGLAMMSVSEKALALIAKSTNPRYYFDLREAKKAAEKADTPFTPAIGIIIALNEAIRLIKKEGLQNLFTRYALMARATREAAKALGLKVFTDASCLSNVLTAISLPANIDGEKLMKIMRDEYGVTVAGGQDKLKGKTIRIAHMGMIDEFDIIAGIACLEKVLKKLGHAFEVGAGVAAAQRVFNT